MKKLLLVVASLIAVITLVSVLDYLDRESPVKVKVSMEGSFFKDAQFIQKKRWTAEVTTIFTTGIHE